MNIALLRPCRASHMIWLNKGCIVHVCGTIQIHGLYNSGCYSCYTRYVCPVSVARSIVSLASASIIGPLHLSMWICSTASSERETIMRNIDFRSSTNAQATSNAWSVVSMSITGIRVISLRDLDPMAVKQSTQCFCTCLHSWALCERA
jgi:hypothetical protein